MNNPHDALRAIFAANASEPDQPSVLIVILLLEGLR